MGSVSKSALVASCHRIQSDHDAREIFPGPVIVSGKMSVASLDILIAVPGPLIPFHMGQGRQREKRNANDKKRRRGQSLVPHTLNHPSQPFCDMYT